MDTFTKKFLIAVAAGTIVLVYVSRTPYLGLELAAIRSIFAGPDHTGIHDSEAAPAHVEGGMDTLCDGVAD